MPEVEWMHVQSHCATSMPRRPYFILLRCHSTSLEDSTQWVQSLFEVAFEYIFCIFCVTFPFAKSKTPIIIWWVHWKKSWEKNHNFSPLFFLYRSCQIWGLVNCQSNFIENVLKSQFEIGNKVRNISLGTKLKNDFKRV